MVRILIFDVPCVCRERWVRIKRSRSSLYYISHCVNELVRCYCYCTLHYYSVFLLRVTFVFLFRCGRCAHHHQRTLCDEACAVVIVVTALCTALCVNQILLLVNFEYARAKKGNGHGHGDDGDDDDDGDEREMRIRKRNNARWRGN